MRFRADVRGATAIEYALIAALISIGIVTWATSIGNTLQTTFNAVANGF